MKFGKLVLWSFLITLNITQSEASNRGQLLDFDSGAPKESRWVDLFAETPNYRAFGEKVISGRGEKFRWKMGPMFYRGRLTPESVKVFIIGQEGAQDENLSNRSFTGSTGTRMQKFINYLGINRSYLFMNTFVYTITGQYSLYGDDAKNEYKKKQWRQLMWLAQNEDSVVVQHRHEMFNYMLETNKKTLSLVIGVGTAGKESLVTWFNSKSPKSCSYSKLTSSHCMGQGELAGVLAIGVRHPGAASARNAGSNARGGLINDFRKKAKVVADYINERPDWLPPDDGTSRDFNKSFKYGYASIPHRDFAFGLPWVLGSKGTSSNRRGSDKIQIFSKNGCYNNGARRNGRCQTIPPNEQPAADHPDERITYLFYTNPRNTLRYNEQPIGFTKDDLPFEPPKSIITRTQYDSGPKSLIGEFTELWEATVNSAFSEEMIQDKSFGPSGFYRGNTSNPKILILADQKSHTDMFSGRAMTGAYGQKLQSFLNGAGLQNKYLIIRSMPVDCLDSTTLALKCAKLKTDKKVKIARNKLIKKAVDKWQIQTLVSYGDFSKKVLENIGNINAKIYHLNAMSINIEEDFVRLFKKMKSNKEKSLNEKYVYASKQSIPRIDLPFSTRWWMGTSGDRASRATNMENITVINGRVRSYNKTTPNGNYYKVYAPNWSSKWSAGRKELTTRELKSIEKFKQTGL